MATKIASVSANGENGPVGFNIYFNGADALLKWRLTYETHDGETGAWDLEKNHQAWHMIQDLILGIETSRAYAAATE